MRIFGIHFGYKKVEGQVWKYVFLRLQTSQSKTELTTVDNLKKYISHDT